jgi:hypothetical protein
VNAAGLSAVRTAKYIDIRFHAMPDVGLGTCLAVGCRGSQSRPGVAANRKNRRRPAATIKPPASQLAEDRAMAIHDLYAN